MPSGHESLLLPEGRGLPKTWFLQTEDMAMQGQQAGPTPGSREGGTAECPGGVGMRRVPACGWK